jgi:hypothetical protein
METVEIDLNIFSKEELIKLIQLSVDKKITIEKLITNILEDFLNSRKI